MNNLSELLEEKRKNNSILKQTYFPKSKNKAIAIINITNNELITQLIEWIQIIPVNFVIIWNYETEKTYNNIVFVKKIHEDIESGFDFVVWDNEMENLKHFLSKWITPIVQENNYLSSVLEEFNPVKVTWNSYLYKEETVWSIFYAIIRYMENYKFPYDNRNLIKNLLEI